MSRVEDKLLVMSILPLLSLSMSYGQTAGRLRWLEPKQLPDQRPLSGMVAGVAQGLLWIAGGNNFDKPILEGGRKVVHDDVYLAQDPIGCDWRYAGNLPQPVADAGCVSLNNSMLIMGGTTDGISPTDQVYAIRWNFAENRLEVDTSFAKLAYPMTAVAVAELDGAVYLAGGRACDGEALDDFWKLEVNQDGRGDTGTWMRMPSWPGPARAGACLVAGMWGGQKALFLIGGKGRGYYQDAYVFLVETGLWQRLPDMPRAVYYGSAIAIDGGSITVFSGSDGHDAGNAIEMADSYHMPSDVFAFDTFDGVWRAYSKMPKGVAGASLIRLADSLLVVGGELRPGVRTDIIQVAQFEPVDRPGNQSIRKCVNE